MSNLLCGVVYDHFETGMEDNCGWAFQDGNHVTLDKYGKPQWSYDGLHFIENGDYLEVLTGGWSTVDGERVLHYVWRGEIDIVVEEVNHPIFNIPVRTYCPRFAHNKQFYGTEQGPLHDQRGVWYDDLEAYTEAQYGDDAFYTREFSKEDYLESIKKHYELLDGHTLWYAMLAREHIGHLRKDQ